MLELANERSYARVPDPLLTLSGLSFVFPYSYIPLLVTLSTYIHVITSTYPCAIAPGHVLPGTNAMIQPSLEVIPSGSGGSQKPSVRCGAGSRMLSRRVCRNEPQYSPYDATIGALAT